MKKILNFLNGKKTIIGLGLMELSHITGIEPQIASIMFMVGSALAGVGFVHKGIKEAGNATDINKQS